MGKFKIGDKVRIEGIIESFCTLGTPYILTKGCSDHLLVNESRLELVEAAPEPIEVGQIWKDEIGFNYEIVGLYGDNRAVIKGASKLDYGISIANIRENYTRIS